jgi:hypothetical protein
MIYHLSLRVAGILAGLFLLFVSVPGLVMPASVRKFLTALPRSRGMGIILLSLAFIWSFWLLNSKEALRKNPEMAGEIDRQIRLSVAAGKPLPLAATATVGGDGEDSE